VARAAALALGSLLAADALFMALTSNFNIGLVLLGALSLALIAYGLLLRRLPAAAHAAVGAACVAALAFAAFLAAYGSSDNARYDESAVIILGAGIRGERVGLLLAQRLDKAIEYYGKNPNAMIVASGGRGFQESVSEAEAMERYLLESGIPQSSIIKEQNSASTYENFLYSRALLLERFPQGFTAVLATNDFHVYRAARTAQHAGISARHIGARTDWRALPANYMREMLAVVKMWLFPPEAASIA
jgi:uncharacterized SAM-binding protein YcdF (DUF218 family)